MTAEEHDRLTDSAEAIAPTESEERDQEWNSTDWTLWQRRRAVAGFFLVAASCGLLAGAFIQWSVVWLAPIVIAPIALTLLCLGIGLIDWVFWYPYQQAGFRPNPTNLHPEHMASLMKLAAGVAVWTLGTQLVLAPWVGFSDWRGFSTAAYLPPCAIGFAAFGGTLAFAGRPGWTPMRASNTADASADGRWTFTPHGIRLLLRWLGLMMATRGGILFLAPMMILVEGDISLTVGNNSLSLPSVMVPCLIVVAAVFALITLSEISWWTSSRSSERQ